MPGVPAWCFRCKQPAVRRRQPAGCEPLRFHRVFLARSLSPWHRSVASTSMPPEVRTLLVRLRETVSRARLSPDADALAQDVLDHLIALHDGGRLTAPFLKIALDPFKDLPHVAHVAEPLLRFAAHQSAAMGHREFKRSSALPWITSSYSALEPRGTLDGLSGFSPSDFPSDA